MTTLTLTLDNRVAALIRRVAAREQKDEAVIAEQLLEWAATQRLIESSSLDAEDADTLSLAARQKQIRQIFERNAW